MLGLSYSLALLADWKEIPWLLLDNRLEPEILGLYKFCFMKLWTKVDCWTEFFCAGNFPLWCSESCAIDLYPEVYRYGEVRVEFIPWRVVVIGRAGLSSGAWCHCLSDHLSYTYLCLYLYTYAYLFKNIAWRPFRLWDHFGFAAVKGDGLWSRRLPPV